MISCSADDTEKVHEPIRKGGETVNDALDPVNDVVNDGIDVVNDGLEEVTGDGGDSNGGGDSNTTTDTTRPTVFSISPNDNSSDVSVSTTVAVTFSKTMTTSTITTNTDNTTCSGSFRLSSDNFTTCIRMSAAPSASNSYKTFSVTPDDNLSGGNTYKLQITTSVTDTSGNSLTDNYTTTNGFTTYSSGTIKGTVKQSNGNALSDVLVSFSGANVDNTTTDNSGNFNKSLGLGSYNLTYTKSGYISTTQSSAIATDNQTVVVATVTLLETSSCGVGNISGTIKDAVSGSAISGVSISIRSGANVTSGSTISGKTDNTTDSGTYTVSGVDAGGYTVQASKSGYITSYFNVNVCGNLTSQNLSISETLSSGTMRIVLHWGANSGLTIVDSHLTGPDNASGRFHIYWPTSKRKFFYYKNDYTCSGCTASQKSDNVTLDKDDTNAPGTETITIPSGSWRSGTYRYSAHDYTNKASTSTTKFSTSGTTVKVYYNGTETTYNVPNSAGNLWTVFSIDGSSKVVTSVNSMSFQTSSTSIQ